MKKRILKTVAIVSCALCMAFGFSGCNAESAKARFNETFNGISRKVESVIGGAVNDAIDDIVDNIIGG